jgi:hypothetical protein
MPELKSVHEIVKSFTSQYDKWSSDIRKNNRNTQGVWFKTDSGSIYMRNMARGILSGELVVCVSSINLNKEYQGKGILSSYIKYIQKNPYIFSEVEVENIHSEELLNSFIKKGFKATKEVENLAFEPLTVCKIIKIKKK